jgi:hypothetical protein
LTLFIRLLHLPSKLYFLGSNPTKKTNTLKKIVNNEYYIIRQSMGFARGA